MVEGVMELVLEQLAEITQAVGSHSCMKKKRKESKQICLGN